MVGGEPSYSRESASRTMRGHHKRQFLKLGPERALINFSSVEVFKGEVENDIEFDGTVDSVSKKTSSGEALASHHQALHGVQATAYYLGATDQVIKHTFPRPKR